MSDSAGYIYEPSGFTKEQLNEVLRLKQSGRGHRVKEYLSFEGKSPDAVYVADAKPFEVPCEVVFPCATQNELDADDAAKLAENNVIAVFEVTIRYGIPESELTFK